ncbi:MAG: protein arginine kinase [Thermoguttaceae bacterium]|nr:protein arginine kinase [Thermoguttaceae bacterium]MBP3694943.1 protein arginine kinase [Thermoguttaceae bacterium]
MTVEELVQSRREWLRNDGPDSEIVVSSRIRLARNAAAFPFIAKLSDDEKKRVIELLRKAVRKTTFGQNCSLFFMDELGGLERKLLVECHLISRELAEGEGPRCAMISPNGHFSLMFIEEDHLRMQCIKSGFCLQEVWREMNDLDTQIEKNLVYAWNQELGYLTACPTNVGTGMRVSVMLHLPALALTRQFNKVHNSLQKISLIVRGLYGEGSHAWGDFYQISNQVTLGLSEEEILSQVHDVVRAVIGYEKKARDFLLEENREKLEAGLEECLKSIRAAKTISAQETLKCLSAIRLGINLGLLSDISLDVVNQLMLQIQPAYLQWIYGGVESSLDASEFRAQYLRKYLLGIWNED